VLESEDATNEDTESGRTRPPKYRYRWTEEAQDDILAGLLELNRTRAEEEAQSDNSVPKHKNAGKGGRKSARSTPMADATLFDVQEPIE